MKRQEVKVLNILNPNLGAGIREPVTEIAGDCITEQTLKGWRVFSTHQWEGKERFFGKRVGILTVVLVRDIEVPQL